MTISGEKGFVRMCGFASGVPYVISNVAGAMVSAGNICDDVENVGGSIRYLYCQMWLIRNESYCEVAGGDW